MPLATIVVPCFNEATRLQPDRFESLRQSLPDVDFVFVDDGSSDGTLALLRQLERSDAQGFSVIECERNRGKAEAVRQGMQRALGGPSRFAGYWDADLSTPLEEIPNFVEILEASPSLDIVFGARVQLLGRSIVRSAPRHYLGRVFATVASTLLKLPVYDTQCGAKLFRNTPEIASLFAEPFCSNWIFDVEIVARLISARRASDGPPVAESIYELPLTRWHDVAGSKVRPIDFVHALVEMIRVHRRYLS